jgi:pimeloyl-ACP methyl ester carboxylesterase
MTTGSGGTGGTTPAALVFIHGGVHTGRCWNETIAVTSELLPDVDAFAVDMLGRRGIPGDLASLTHEICAQTLADQILERVGPDRDSPVVIVGHSLAGVVIPGVVQRLGGDRVRHVVFVACCVPSPGQSVVQTLPFPLNRIARRIVERKPVISAPRGVVRYFFGNLSTRAQRAEIRDNLCAESSAILTGISTERLPEAVPKSWVLPTRDRALPPHFQRRFIDSVGGVDNLATIDAGHEVMITHPRDLAVQIVELVFR